MRWFVIFLSLFAGCIVEDGGDRDLPPEPTVQDASELAVRLYASRLADAWDAEADRLEADPSRAETLTGQTIEEETKAARIESFKPLNRIMSEGVTPEKLRQAAEGARRVVQ